MRSNVNLGALGRLAVLLCAIAAFLGCDGKPNLSGLDALVDGSSNLGTSSLSGPLLRISPLSASISRVKEEVVFTADGGKPPYDWTIANLNNGKLRSEGPKQVRYEVKNLSQNQVIVTDSSGQSAIGYLIYGDAGLSVDPSSVTLTANGQQATFLAVGGDSPYSWTVTYPGRGHIVGTSGAQVRYQRDTVGANAITVVDGNGFTASAAITQEDPSPPVITPSISTMASNVTSVLLTASGGTPGYTWSVTTGTGSVNPPLGSQTVYTRNPGDPPGQYFVQVKDSGLNTATATINQQ